MKGINYPPLKTFVISDISFYRPGSAYAVLASLFPGSYEYSVSPTTRVITTNVPSECSYLSYMFTLRDVFVLFDTMLLPPTLAKDVLDLSLANPVVVPESCGTTEVIKVDPAPQETA